VDTRHDRAVKPAHLIRMRQRRRQQAKTGPARRLVQIAVPGAASVLALIAAIPVAVAATAVGVYVYFTRDLPDVSRVEGTVSKDFQTTKIFDRNGQLLYEIIDQSEGDRQWAKLPQVSKFLTCATVAIEDKTFWDNQGFDVRGIARAAVQTLQGGRQGGSGITQQVIKNVVLPPEERSGPKRTTQVKIKEVLLSAELTRRYEKEQILEWYVNTNFYGNLAYGIEAAAKTYFGKSAADLTLAEAAMIAPIPQSPRKNPFTNPVAAKDRQELVLDLMVERSKFGVRDCNVTPQMAADAKRDQLRLANKTERFGIKAPHFSVYARDRAVDLLADQRGIGVEAATELVNRGGLKITTSLDLTIDDEVRRIANEQIAKLQAEQKNANNASVVVIRQGTGEILAMVGSIDFYNRNIDGEFNVATGLRQPGSSFKPITYLELLRQGSTPATFFWDVRKTFDSGTDVPYVPENYDRKYHGPVRLRNALARSYNIPAVEALERAGIGNVIRLAQKLGITDLDRGLQYYGLALTLGGGEVKLLDMTYAYATIANGSTMIGAPRPKDLKKAGFRDLDPVSILRIEDTNGAVLYDFKPAINPDLIGPDSKKLSYLLWDIMSDPQARAAAFGLPSVLDLDNQRQAAVKTGTTNDYKDNWTLGFTTDFTVGVWVGNTDNSAMSKGVSGLTGAAPIWKNTMEYLHRSVPPRAFEQPEGLEESFVCLIDGLLSNGVCPAGRELFLPGTKPTRASTVVQKFPINRETQKLALPGTPPELVEEKLMYVFPPQAADWYASLSDDEKQQYPVAPTDFDTRFGGTVASGDVAITFPANGGFVSAVAPPPAPTPPPTPDPNIPIDPNNPPTPIPPPDPNLSTPGIIPIRGNAKGGNWLSYRIYIGPGLAPAPEQFQQIGPEHPNQVDNNLLEYLDLRAFQPGLYTLKVARLEADGRVTENAIQFTLDNTPPAARLTQPRPGEAFKTPDDEWVDVIAAVNDDNSISKVEFYAGDVLFETKTTAPFTVKWTIGRSGGVPNFKVVVYDAAGNKAESAPVGVSVTAGSAP
jgi:membrane peptidoglycan carboxypeptidase